MAISLTEIASHEVRHICDTQNLSLDKTYLRVSIKGGGCSGFSYRLDLTENISNDDELFESNGIQIACDPRSHIYLNGTEISFKDEIMSRGFMFSNPNATSTCGCGSSFSA